MGPVETKARPHTVTSQNTPTKFAVRCRQLVKPRSQRTITLDEYPTLLERMDFRLFEGELYELTGRLRLIAGDVRLGSVTKGFR